MMPALFVSHGAPSIALQTEGAYARALRAFGESARGAGAIVIVSAHWQSGGRVLVNSGARPGVMHDFSGFPDALHELGYDAVGEPRLAARIVELLGAAPEPRRPWDHGVWVPLRLMLPDPRLPVVQVSLPELEPRALFELGRRLAVLRDEGVLLIGSGGLVHNLARLDWTGGDVVPPWASAFERWVIEHALGDDLFAYRTRAPHAALAVPTSEHFDPLFVIMGARAASEGVTTVYEGFSYGSLSLRTLAVGGAREK